ncbi:MAG: FHA domain-containing protein, partial [Halieaceae bacterium]
MDITAVLVDHEEQEHALTGAMNVGRSADCAITIDDAKVSRVHAIFRVDGGQLVVEDMGSSNGTRVNELKIDKPTPVYNGDKICFEKHCYKLVVSGGAEDMDATVVDSDATVVSAFEEPTVQESAPSADPPPAESGEGSMPESLDDLDLPGSWVDDGTGDETRVLSMDQAGATGNVQQDADAIERMSELAHLVVVTEGGAAGEVFELAPGGTEEPDVWELGRDADCELNISDPSVSGRHAQLS